MKRLRTLPDELVRRYQDWMQTGYAASSPLRQQLAQKGQTPMAMVISCCDSRLLPTEMFEAGHGDFFIHRNIANLVPADLPGGVQHGTAAAVEYAVTVLKVSHLIVLGHSSCGGVRGCYDMCSGNAPALEDRTSFVGRWLDNLRPAYDRLPDADTETRVAAMEKLAIVVSLKNLLSYSFVAEALASEQLQLHGAWTDIGAGTLEHYDPDAGEFIKVPPQ